MAWLKPKTDWQASDFFNIQDYNRIKGNLNEIRTQALTLWPDFPFEEMGADKTYQDYGFYADEINRFEENVDYICAGTYPFPVGEKQTFYENQPFIDWQELNRIEEACRLMYSNILSRINGRRRLAFVLNGGVFFMALKTDYKDAMFDGDRKYRITANTDGTSRIADETAYTQEGDSFGANDINATNKAVNLLNHTTQVTLTAAGWTGSAAPYTQTVEVEGATEEMEAILVSALASGADLDTQKAYAKAFGIISSGTAELGDGTATFRVYKKPATDCTVGLKGV